MFDVKGNLWEIGETIPVVLPFERYMSAKVYFYSCTFYAHYWRQNVAEKNNKQVENLS